MSRTVETLIKQGVDKGFLRLESGRILFLEHGKGYLEKPEERVRAATYVMAIEDLKYTPDEIDVQVSIQLGAARWDYADIIIYTDNTRTAPRIIIETKRPEREDGVGQLKVYMNATGAPAGWWTNGVDEVFLHRRAPNVFLDLPRMPIRGERIEEIGQEIRRQDLIPAVDLQSDFHVWENYILAHQGVDVFNELFKLIYAKLCDEYINLKTDSSICQFRASIDEPPEQVASRIQGLFDQAIREWGIFQTGERIELHPQLLKDIVIRMQRYYLRETDIDVLGTGFEYLVTSTMKGEKGQYFTPRVIIEMMGKAARISKSDRVLDPACGSGGFLIWTLLKVWNDIASERGDSRSIARAQYDYATRKLFGIDYEARMVKIAQANMLIRGDSRSNIFLEDSLRDYLWGPPLTRYVQPNGVDVILTNPPFAGDIKDIDVLKNFALAHKKDKLMEKQGRHILFLEVCLKYIHSGGILAIIMPKGVFNNPTLKYVRDFIQEKAQILACISLDPYVFAPHTGNRTGVLILKKKSNSSEEMQDYEIFMAISEKSGKKQGGRPLFRTDADGNLLLDAKGKFILDSDLSDIADAFLTSAIPEKLKDRCFYVKKTQLKDRIDPEYYQPLSQQFLDNLVKSGQQLKPLKEIATYTRESIDPAANPSSIFRYIELDDVNALGMIERARLISGKEAPSRARILVHTGDIITAMSGSKTGSSTRHRAAIIEPEYDGCVVSTGFGVLRPREGTDLYYLYALIRSPYVLSEMRRRLQGGGIPKISEDDLMNILIPVIPHEKQVVIGAQIKKALSDLREAKITFDSTRQQIQELLGVTTKELPEAESEEEIESAQ